jgi:ParB family chromosome partitioning protein
MTPINLAMGPWVGPLDPASIGVSRFDARHPSALAGADFLNLKAAIAETGVNLVPVLVRKLRDGPLELVYGRRRLQACLELGLPVESVVRELSDHEAFESMVRICVPSWSLYELGHALQLALDAGLYPSHRRAAQACGVPLGTVQLASEVAGWGELLAAFATPTAITPSVARAVRGAWFADPAGVLQRARALAVARSRLPATKVAAHLAGHA